MTTPAALTPALAAWAATSSSEVAATFAIAATSSRRAISPMLKGPLLSIQRIVARKGVKLQTKFLLGPGQQSVRNGKSAANPAAIAAQALQVRPSISAVFQ